MGIANLVSNSVEKETKVMWCKNCNLETNEAICPVCGLETSEDLPVEIYWCNDCRIPVIHVSTAAEQRIQRRNLGRCYSLSRKGIPYSS